MMTFEEWAAAAEERTVDGLRLAVHDHGGGPAVTFLHGYPSSSLDAVPAVRAAVRGRPAGDARPARVRRLGQAAGPRLLDPRRDRRGRGGVGAARRRRARVVVAHDYSVSVGQELLARRLDAPGRGTAITGVVWCNGGLWSDLHRQTVGQQLLLDPEHGAAVADAMDEAALTNGLARAPGAPGDR